MNYKEKIAEYINLVTDTEISPFESIDGLHIRDALEEQLDHLNADEREQLRKADLKLFLYANKVYEHLQSAFNFHAAAKPSSGWWWNLPQIAQDHDKKRSAQ